MNTKTFTIDLRTGCYLPHDARDLITKIAPVNAKPNSKCPVFDKFIARITGGDLELATYTQRAVGYTLTGMTTEQVLFFPYGKSGNNGKSTLVNLIREMLGDYAAHTPSETLLTKNYDNAIPADLARLEGKRMVTAIESNVNRQLDEAKIKAMTGGEPITARHLSRTSRNSSLFSNCGSWPMTVPMCAQPMTLSGGAFVSSRSMSKSRPTRSIPTCRTSSERSCREFCPGRSAGHLHGGRKVWLSRSR